MEYKSLPVGIDDFRKIRENDFYYVDKTGMITELLRSWGEVNLFTRPRRFGKTLNLSMLKCFFEPDTDKGIFEGLAISKENALCRQYMGKYPVLNFSLKQVCGLSYQDAETQMWTAVSMEANRYRFLQESERLDDIYKRRLQLLRMGEGNLRSAIMQLSEMLYIHYNQKVIILIDEYDVPLQKAEARGYYGEMSELISQILGYGMKTNPYMEFAVVTGCLRVVKESIFTGFNNPKMHTVIDREYDEWFGFTDVEVQEMLGYYDQSRAYELTKKWYDGYLFGDKHIYCPWDVINWVNQLVRNGDDTPRNFWANSSSNDMVQRFASQAQGETKEQLEQLLAGNSVWKKMNLELTYNELDTKIENLWSVLLMTGYLTYRDKDAEGLYELMIPNQEIHNLFREMIDQWFADRIIEDKENLTAFFDALETLNAEKLEDSINYYLEESISYLDGGRSKEKEVFYHGMILGMLQARTGWIVKSNREAGNGRLDIVTYPKKGSHAIIFEFKSVKDFVELERAAETALLQIDEKSYDRFFEARPVKEIIHIGMAFCKKRCKVLIRRGGK